MKISNEVLSASLMDFFSNMDDSEQKKLVTSLVGMAKNLEVSTQLTIKCGWFLTWMTSLSPNKIDEQTIDAHMIKLLEVHWDQLKIDLVEEYPNRKKILEEAFKLHEEERYIASIPLFFSQADGICQDKLNGTGYFSNNSKRRKAHQVITEIYEEIEGDKIDNLKFLLDPFRAESDKEPSNRTIVSQKSKNISIPEKFPNRHGILHGDPNHVGYGTKINSLKAFSFLLSLHLLLEEISTSQNKKENE